MSAVAELPRGSSDTKLRKGITHWDEAKHCWLCPSLPVKPSVDCSVQSLKEQLSLITSRLALEGLSSGKSKAHVQIGHLRLSRCFNSSCQSISKSLCLWASPWTHRAEVPRGCIQAPSGRCFEIPGAVEGQWAMSVLTYHGNQKRILGCEERFVTVCVRLLMAICFNYIVDLFTSASCTVLFPFYSFQESNRGWLISYIHTHWRGILKT